MTNNSNKRIISAILLLTLISFQFIDTNLFQEENIFDKSPEPNATYQLYLSIDSDHYHLDNIKVRIYDETTLEWQWVDPHTIIIQHTNYKLKIYDQQTNELLFMDDDFNTRTDNYRVIELDSIEITNNSPKEIIFETQPESNLLYGINSTNPHLNWEDYDGVSEQLTDYYFEQISGNIPPWEFELDYVTKLDPDGAQWDKTRYFDISSNSQKNVYDFWIWQDVGGDYPTITFNDNDNDKELIRFEFDVSYLTLTDGDSTTNILIDHGLTSLNAKGLLHHFKLILNNSEYILCYENEVLASGNTNNVAISHVSNQPDSYYIDFQAYDSPFYFYVDRINQKNITIPAYSTRNTVVNRNNYFQSLNYSISNIYSVLDTSLILNETKSIAYNPIELGYHECFISFIDNSTVGNLLDFEMFRTYIDGEFQPKPTFSKLENSQIEIRICDLENNTLQTLSYTIDSDPENYIVIPVDVIYMTNNGDEPIDISLLEINGHYQGTYSWDLEEVHSRMGEFYYSNGGLTYLQNEYQDHNKVLFSNSSLSTQYGSDEIQFDSNFEGWIDYCDSNTEIDYVSSFSSDKIISNVMVLSDSSTDGNAYNKIYLDEEDTTYSFWIATNVSSSIFTYMYFYDTDSSAITYFRISDSGLYFRDSVTAQLISSASNEFIHVVFKILNDTHWNIYANGEFVNTFETWYETTGYVYELRFFTEDVSYSESYLASFYQGNSLDEAMFSLYPSSYYMLDYRETDYKVGGSLDWGASENPDYSELSSNIGDYSVIDSYLNHDNVMKLDASYEDATINYYFESTNYGFAEWYLNVDEHQDWAWQIRFIHETGDTMLRSLSTTSLMWNHITEDGEVNDNYVVGDLSVKFNHFAVEWNGNTINLYVNGEFVFENNFDVGKNQCSGLKFYSANYQETVLYIDSIGVSINNYSRYSNLIYDYYKTNSLDWGYYSDTYDYKLNDGIAIDGVVQWGEDDFDSFDYKIDSDLTSIKTGVVNNTFSLWSNLSDIGCYADVISEYNNHLNVFELNDQNSAQSKIRYSFESQISGSLEFFWSFSDPSKTSYCYIQSGGAIGVYLYQSGNNIAYYNGTDGIVLKTGITSDVWYHILIEFDTDSDTFDLTVDGISAGNDLLFNQNTSGMTTINFYSNTGYSDYSQYIDALGVSWDSYTTGDNIPVYVDDWEYISYSNCNISTTDIGTHENAIILTDSSTTDACYLYSDFTSSSYGTFEFYAEYTSSQLIYRFYEGSTYGIQILFSAGNLIYYNGSDYPILQSINYNQLYHIRVDFRCIGGSSYEGLSEDRFKITIDGTEYDDLLMVNTISSVNKFRLSTQEIGQGTYYFDAIGITPNSYTLSDNQQFHDFIDNCRGNTNTSIIDELNSHHNVLELEDQDSNERFDLFYYFDEQISGTFEFYFNTPDPEEMLYFYLGDGGSASAILFKIDTDRSLNYYISSWNYIDTIESDEWYHFSIEFDCSSTWNLKLNGIEYKDLSFRGSPTAIDMFNCYGVDTQTNHIVYLDGIGMTWEQNYQSYDNIPQPYVIDGSFEWWQISQGKVSLQSTNFNLDFNHTEFTDLKDYWWIHDWGQSGNPTSSWDLYEPTSVEISIQDFDGREDCLVLNDSIDHGAGINSGSTPEFRADGYMKYNFDGISSGYLSYWMQWSPDTPIIFEFGEDDDVAAYYEIYITSLNLYSGTSTSENLAKNPSPNTWYHFLLWVDCENDEFYMWIDNEGGFALKRDFFMDLDSINFINISSSYYTVDGWELDGPSAKIYFDDLYVGTDLSQALFPYYPECDLYESVSGIALDVNYTISSYGVGSSISRTDTFNFTGEWQQYSLQWEIGSWGFYSANDLIYNTTIFPTTFEYFQFTTYSNSALWIDAIDFTLENSHSEFYTGRNLIQNHSTDLFSWEAYPQWEPNQFAHYQTLDDWGDLSSGNCELNIVDELDDHHYVLELSDTDGAEAVARRYIYGANEFEFYFRSTTITERMYMYLYSLTTLEEAVYFSATSGQYHVWNAKHGAKVISTDLEIDTWYHTRFVKKGNFMDVYFCGELILSNLEMTAGDDLTHVLFFSDYDGSDFSYYIDYFDYDTADGYFPFRSTLENTTISPLPLELNMSEQIFPYSQEIHDFIPENYLVKISDLAEITLEFQNLTSADSEIIYTPESIRTNFISITDQQSNYLDWEQFKIYRNDTLLYENTFQAPLLSIWNISVYDRFGNFHTSTIHQVVREENFIALSIELYSLKIYNQQEVFLHVNITQDSTEYFWSEWIAPKFIADFRLIPDSYIVKITDYEDGESTTNYNLDFAGDDILLISSENTLASVIMSFTNLNTTLDEQFTYISLNFTNVDSAIGNQTTIIEINFSNINTTFEEVLLAQQNSFVFINSSLGDILSYTENSFEFMNTSLNTLMTSTTNSFIFMNSSLDEILVNQQNSFEFLNSSVTNLYSLSEDSFVFLNSSANSLLSFSENSFTFLNSSIVDLAAQSENSFTFLNSSISDLSTVSLASFSYLNSSIENSITYMAQNFTFVNSKIDTNQLEILTQFSVINSNITNNSLEIINNVLAINSSISDLVAELSNYVFLVNDTIYTAVLNTTTQLQIDNTQILGNLSIVFEQNEFLTDILKNTMFSELLNWTNVGYNYTLIEDQIETISAINNYKDEAINLILKYQNETEEIVLSALDKIQIDIPESGVEYRVFSVSTQEYLTEWKEIPEDKTIDIGFYEEVVPVIPDDILDTAFDDFILIGIVAVVCIIGIAFLALRYRTQLDSMPTTKKSSRPFRGKSTEDLMI